MSQFAPLAIAVVVGAFDASPPLVPHGAVYDKPVRPWRAALSQCKTRLRDQWQARKSDIETERDA
jgi:hypothetical protein